MKHLFFTFLILCACLAQAQLDPAYPSYAQKADSLYNAKQYQASGEMYANAFKLNGRGMINDRYNAACSWALAGGNDSAFVQLFKIANKVKWDSYDQLREDKDLIPLYKDKRWDELCVLVKKNKEEAEAKLNKPLTALLENIHKTDQDGRQMLDSIGAKFGYESKEIKDLWAKINVQDSANLLVVSWILDRYGWLGADEVGGRGNSTIFLVIQHSDIKAQEKYLPMMRDATKNKKANPADLALLEDRVALRQDKKQIYGSQVECKTVEGKQVCNLFPIEDEINVNKRRAEVGLPPLEIYVKHWGIDYKPLK